MNIEVEMMEIFPKIVNNTDIRLGFTIMKEPLEVEYTDLKQRTMNLMLIVIWRKVLMDIQVYISYEKILLRNLVETI